METTKNNQEEAKEELLNKRDILSEEELMEVAGGTKSSEFINDELDKWTGGAGIRPAMSE